MATSSLYKTFSLRTQKETNVFMQKFEEHLSNSRPIEKSSVKMATESDTGRLADALRRQYGDKLTQQSS